MKYLTEIVNLYAKYLISLIIFFNLVLVLFFQPRWILTIVEHIIPGVVYFAQTEQPIIALTIDDVPNNKTTLLILDVLKKHNVKATFFVTSSQVGGNEQIIEAIVNDSHELGNHMTEDKPSIKLSREEFETDLLKAHSIITKFADIHWMRPASGWYNSEMIEIAKKHNYHVSLGSVFPYDTHIKSTWFSVNHIMLNVAPGSIIVLHDGNSRGQRTASTLAEILPKLKEKGYSFVTLSKLFSP